VPTISRFYGIVIRMYFADHAPPHFMRSTLARSRVRDRDGRDPSRGVAAMNTSRTTITKVEPLAERWIRLTFADGAVHEVDLSTLL
jgi:hypothetical protein